MDINNQKQTLGHKTNTAPPKRAFRAEDLFEGQNELKLLYRDEEYRLRITKNRKLILTK